MNYLLACAYHKLISNGKNKKSKNNQNDKNKIVICLYCFKNFQNHYNPDVSINNDDIHHLQILNITSNKDVWQKISILIQTMPRLKSMEFNGIKSSKDDNKMSTQLANTKIASYAKVTKGLHKSATSIYTIDDALRENLGSSLTTAKYLQSLIIYNTTFTAKGFEYLANAVRNNMRITFLSVRSSVPPKCDKWLIFMLNENTVLKKLKLSHIDTDIYGRTSWRNCSWLEKNTTLKSLSIDNVPMGAFMSNFKKYFAQNATLKSLRLSNCIKEYYDDKRYEYIQNMTSFFERAFMTNATLTKLDLSGNLIGCHLNKMQMKYTNNTMKKLVLKNNNIDDIGLKLILKRFCNLRELDLYWNSISKRSSYFLCLYIKKGTLEKLNLSSNACIGFITLLELLQTSNTSTANLKTLKTNLSNNNMAWDYSLYHQEIVRHDLENFLNRHLTLKTHEDAIKYKIAEELEKNTTLKTLDVSCREICSPELLRRMPNIIRKNSNYKKLYVVIDDNINEYDIWLALTYNTTLRFFCHFLPNNDDYDNQISYEHIDRELKINNGKFTSYFFFSVEQLSIYLSTNMLIFFLKMMNRYKRNVMA